ncbi:carbohydrate ABC transporter permease [Paenibacillus chitinolyticus]|uniref:carbohydrate ABC transporter permease n=1 Tax=Paenibacillus chitinolyticus TaxID=79263 RepID=UPI0035DB99F3
MNTVDESLPIPVGNARSIRTASWWNRVREAGVGYLFLLPSLAGFGIFLFYPFFQSLYLSVHSTNLRGKIAEYVGFENYRELLTSEKFYHSLGVTAQFALLTIPTTIAAALLLAALTHRGLKGKRVYQFIFSLPMALSVGTASVIWALLFHPTAGMLNYWLGLLGQAPVAWLSDPSWALISVSLMTVWMNLGFAYIVLLSGLQSVPEDMYDSAKIDGAGPMRTFFRIVLPLVSPTLFFVGVVSLIGAFQSFGQIQILTKGGPMDTTNVMVYSLYQEAFVNFRFGSGSAQAILLFVIVLFFTFVQFGVLERKVHYS